MSIQIPIICPSCKTSLIYIGEYLICPNKETCPSQVIGRLNKWIKELGILEWGESILTKLIASGKVKDVADLYKLTAADISSLDRMGEKSAENLIKELDKYREVTLENFLGGLCIDGIATSMVKLIKDNGLDSLDLICKASPERFERIPGFGEKRAAAFHEGLASNANRILDILGAGVKIKEKVKGALTNIHVCFTGTMSTPRKKLQAMVAEAGGEIDKSVTKKTTYLVIDDPESTSDKAQAARKIGTKLISEKQFLDML